MLVLQNGGISSVIKGSSLGRKIGTFYLQKNNNRSQAIRHAVSTYRNVALSENAVLRTWKEHVKVGFIV